MTTTETVIDSGKQQVDRFSRWLKDRIDNAPDLADTRDFANEKSRQTIESARDRVEGFGKWLGDLAVEMNVIEPPKKRRSRKVAGGVAITAVAVGGWYFFNPSTGKQHRHRIRSYFSRLWCRATGRLDDIDVFDDGQEDLMVVGERPASDMKGISVNS